MADARLWTQNRGAMASALVLGLLAFAGAAQAGGSAGATYDLVVAGGRVMDPESGLDGVRDVGIRAGKHRRRLGPCRWPAARRSTPAGCVVAPGFIDLHAHGQDAENYALRAADGVTTALELEIGAGGRGRASYADAGRARRS